MLRKLCLLLAMLLLAAGARAQLDLELEARRRVFTDAGPGVRDIQRGPAGRYYVLTAPAPAVGIYDAEGKRVAQIPAQPDKTTAITYGESLDVDAEGRVYVADRGANAVKIYAPEGEVLLVIPVAAPVSVAALSGGEVAVASMKSEHLVTVYDLRGKVVREFGALSDIAERTELRRFLNVGMLGRDSEDHLYYAFDYLPEPTVRKYDRYGYARAEVTLTAIEFLPAAQAVRREIRRQERGGTPAFKPIITALGVDPAAQEIWIALGDLLIHFDRDGNRRGTYRTYTPDGGRLAATSIVVEPDRLLLAADPLGIYEFARPDVPTPSPAAKK